jgi:8-oxo-dGTP diphosphatase
VTPTVIVLRHGYALSRGDWAGPDRDRPLTPAGREQAATVVAMACGQDIRRVLSSPATRCVQTIAKLLIAADASAELLPGLAEEATAPQYAHAARTVAGLLHGDCNALVCSHRPVLPGLFAAIAGAGGPPPPVEPLQPGEYLVIRGAALLARDHS